MKTLTATIKITISISFCVILWASAYVGIRIGLQSYSPGCLALFRYLIASCGMIVLYLFFSKRDKPQLKDLPLIFFMGATGFGIYNITLNYGELTVSAGITGFIIGQMPVVIAILAALLLKEKMTRLGILGMVICFLGITLIAISHHSNTQQLTGSLDLGIIYLIIATLCGAAYGISYKFLAHKYDPIALTAFAIWSGTLVLLLYTPTLSHEIKAASRTANLAVVYLGIFPAVIGYLAYSYALRFMPVSRASSYLFVIPLITTLLGWLILDEIPTLLALLGGIIALLGAMITIKYKTSKK